MKIGFFGLLTLMFIGLKISGIIDWAWLWVLAPLWGPLAIYLMVLGVLFLVAYLIQWLEYYLEKHNK